MAPIRRFSAEEKGKAPREGPDPLPPKKRLVLCRRDEGARQEVSRPWCERPPPGFPLPLYAHLEGPAGADAERHGRRRRRRRRVTAVRVVPPGVHAEGSSREFVLHAAMPPRSWIRLPPSFAFEIPPRGPFRLWLQHADCQTPATDADVEVVAPGKVFMTRGWGEIARVCRTRGALVIHLEFDGASMMLFKVFDEDGRRLECCPRGSGRSSGAAGTRPAAARSSSSSSSGGGAGGSSDSAELFATPETSDDSYEPPSLRRSRSRTGSLGRRRL